MSLWRSGFLILAMICCVVVFTVKREHVTAVTKRVASGQVQVKQFPIIEEKCAEACLKRHDQRRGSHGGDLMSNADLLLLVQKSRDRVIDDIKSKYGGSEMFSKIFESSPGTLRQPFLSPTSDGVSLKRFQNKLQMKILEVQASISRENKNLFNGCDCNGDTVESRRQAPSFQQNHSVPVSRFMSRFVWSTTGHSVAAGHGNLHNESYTAFLEHAAKPVFDAIGIEFEGRNYGMGGKSSAPLLALCNEAIYGLDVDVLSWDFGMSDGRNFDKKGMFANRAGVHRNRPAIIDLDLFGKIWPERIEELKVAESYGLTTLFISEVHQKMMDQIPDMFGMCQEQIDATPEYIRYMKCKDSIEKGDPGCSNNKYSSSICEKRLHKTSWHPGWRVHAMFGFCFGLFLIDALTNAIEGLGQNDYDPERKLQQLKDDEDKLYKRFFESTVDSARVKGFLGSNITQGIDPQTFYRERIMCHTALLPSETRYNGYLEGVRTLNKEAFEKGEAHQAIAREPADGRLRLGFESIERQKWCPVKLNIDFRDYFYANANDGWVNVTFPNDLEIEVYGPWKPRGVVIFCATQCMQGACANAERSVFDLNNHQLEITINGISVSRLWSLSQGQECGVAQGPNGWYFPQNNDGRYYISLRVKPSNNGRRPFTRFSSILAY